MSDGIKPEDVEKLTSSITKLIGAVDVLNTRVAGVEKRLDDLGALTAKVDGVEKRLDDLGALTTKVDGIEKRLDDLGALNAKVGKRLDDLGEQIATMQPRELSWEEKAALVNPDGKARPLRSASGVRITGAGTRAIGQAIYLQR